MSAEQNGCLPQQPIAPLDRSRFNDLTLQRFNEAKLLLNPFQEKNRAAKGDQRPHEKDHEVADIKLRARAIHVHEPKGAAKMCKRENFGNVADGFGQLIEWRERA